MNSYEFLEALTPFIVEDNRYAGQSAKTMIEQLHEVSKFGLRSASKSLYIIGALQLLSPETKAQIIAELNAVREKQKEI